MPQRNTIRFFDMFAGVGGFRAGLNRAGGFQCAGHCEIDRYAEKAYRAVYNVKESEVYHKDATTIDPNSLPEFELLTAGFPCQPFSIAGKRKGFFDPRGTLFFDIARVAREKRPLYLLLENVPGLLSHDKGRTFGTILDTLSGLGYGVEWQVLNSKDFGVPQSRRRVYIVGYLNSECAGKILPIRNASPKTAGWHIRKQSEAQDSDKTELYAVGYDRKNGISGKIDVAHTLLASNYRGLNRRGVQNAVIDGTLRIKEATRQGYKEARVGDAVDLTFSNTNTRRGRVGQGLAHTLDTSASQGVVTPCGRIRRLTPRECFRLQGFSDEQINKLLKDTSDTHAYKQAGNAVTVQVVHALGLRLRAAHTAIQGANRDHPSKFLEREKKTGTESSKGGLKV